MKTYGDLNLKKIRIDNDLHFAHYTYKHGQCSCCYGPRDLPAKYWKDGKILDEYPDDFSYILFKNAENGSGRIKNKAQVIDDYTCISWKMPREKLIKVCSDLMAQLDEDYFILIPKNDSYTIIIRTYEDYMAYFQLTSFELVPNDKKCFDLII